MNIVYAIYKMVFFRCKYKCIVAYKNGGGIKYSVHISGNRLRHENLLFESMPFSRKHSMNIPYNTCVSFQAKYIEDTMKVINCSTDIEDNNEENPGMNYIFDDDNIQNEVWKASEYSKSIKPSMSSFKCTHLIKTKEDSTVDIRVSGTIEDHFKILHAEVIKAHMKYGSVSLMYDLEEYSKLNEIKFLPDKSGIDIFIRDQNIHITDTWDGIKDISLY